jgi:hypothetical protein
MFRFVVLQKKKKNEATLFIVDTHTLDFDWLARQEIRETSRFLFLCTYCTFATLEASRKNLIV